MAVADRSCPGCGQDLPGLGTYCHDCKMYTDQCPATPRTPRRPSEPLGPLTLTLPLPPSSNASWRSLARVRAGFKGVAVAYATGKASFNDLMKMVFVSVVRSGELRQFHKDAARWAALQDQGWFEDGEVKLSVTWFLERWGSDTDNRLKALLDFLEGLVFENDKIVAEIHVVRRKDTDRPRCVVTVEAIDEPAVLHQNEKFQYDLGF